MKLAEERLYDRVRWKQRKSLAPKQPDNIVAIHSSPGLLDNVLESNNRIPGRKTSRGPNQPFHLRVSHLNSTPSALPNSRNTTTCPFKHWAAHSFAGGTKTSSKPSTRGPRTAAPSVQQLSTAVVKKRRGTKTECGEGWSAHQHWGDLRGHKALELPESSEERLEELQAPGANGGLSARPGRVQAKEKAGNPK